MEGQSDRRLVAVMFCDMVGFTAAMQEDEQVALASRDRYRTVIEHLHDELRGEIVPSQRPGRKPLVRQAGCRHTG